MTPRARALAVGTVVLALAAGLRCWRLSWGLADQLFFPDEIIWIVRGAAFIPLTLRSFALDFTLPYPALFGYLTGLSTVAAHALGTTAPPPALALDIVWIARCLSVAADLGNVLLAGLLGARLYGRTVGLGAAALMAVVPLSAVHVHYGSVDPLLTACVTGTVLAALALLRGGGAGTAVLAGLLAGLGFATKYTGLAALVAPAVAIAERAWRERSPRTALRLGVLVLAGAAAGIFAGCPPCVLEAPTMLRAMGWAGDIQATGEFLNARPVASLGWYGRSWLYELVAGLPFGLGLPIYVLALAGFVGTLVRRNPAERVLLTALATYFVAIGTFPLKFPRYLMPLFPGLVVLGARAALGERGRPARVVLLVVAVVSSAALAATQVATISFEQQRAVARWIAQNVRPAPAGGAVRVGLPTPLDEYWALESFLRREGLLPLPTPAGRWLEPAPDAFVVPDWLAIGIRRDRPGTPEARQLEELAAGTSGYRAAARWPTWYLGRDVYAYLDPGLQPGLGAYGFTVFVRGEAADAR